MRGVLLPVFTILSLTVVLPGIAHGDFVTIVNGPAACCNLHPFGMEDLATPTFLSSNPDAWWAATGGAFAYLQASPGSLIASDDTTAIFGPGTIVLHGDNSVVQIPNGTSCADFGWQTNYSPGRCDIDIGLSGTTGEAVLSLGSIVGTFDFGVERRFVAATPVTFDITADLAFALGISTGHYVGSFSSGGTLLETALEGPFWGPAIQIDSMVVSGFAVPEPPPVISLGTVIVGVCFALKRRFSSV